MISRKLAEAAKNGHFYVSTKDIEFSAYIYIYLFVGVYLYLCAARCSLHSTFRHFSQMTTTRYILFLYTYIGSRASRLRRLVCVGLVRDRGKFSLFSTVRGGRAQRSGAGKEVAGAVVVV